MQIKMIKNQQISNLKQVSYEPLQHITKLLQNIYRGQNTNFEIGKMRARETKKNDINTYTNLSLNCLYVFKY